MTEIPQDGLLTGEDGVTRCSWACSAPEYRAYHDSEWGFPVSDDVRLFEKLSLEGFQAGLSWLTILRKREAFRQAFADFDFHRVARFTGHDVKRLLADAGIVRHRGKIEAVINNAERTLELVEAEGSLARYIWRFEPKPRPGKLDRARPAQLAVTPESKALAKDLKRRGWRFVGPTTMYAFMQSMGLVNDHLEGCQVRRSVDGARTESSDLEDGEGGKSSPVDGRQASCHARRLLCVRLLGVGDPELILVAEVHGRAALMAELRAVLSELADGANGESGCVGFRVLSGDEAGEFVLLASWTSEGALRTHYTTAHYRRYREQVGPLLARPSDVVVHHLAATVHAVDPNPPDPGKLG